MMFSWMMEPKRRISFIVSSSEMAKVDIVGRNTIMMPLTTPGMERGTITLRNTRSWLAPRSCAASMRFLSIFIIVLYIG